MLFQTDIYSYGVILYELLAGQVPFPLKDNGETARNAVMIAHLESEVPDLLKLRRKNMPETWTAAQQEREMQVPVWLLDMVLHCLKKSPENRYNNGMQLQEAIVENSIADIKTDKANNVNKAVLHKEIGGLTAPANSAPMYEPGRNGMVYISRPVFAGLMFLLLGFMVFTGYTLFYKPSLPVIPVTKKTVVDSVKSPDSSNMEAENENRIRREREKQKEEDSITQKTIDDAIKGQKQKDVANPDSTGAVTDTTNKPANN